MSENMQMVDHVLLWFLVGREIGRLIVRLLTA